VEGAAARCAFSNNIIQPHNIVIEAGGVPTMGPALALRSVRGGSPD
jgi:hypothetical protein